MARIKRNAEGAGRVRTWEIETDKATPAATIGHNRDGTLRVELAIRFNRSVLASDLHHKDRRVVARGMRPAVAREIGQALIEAANQADRLGRRVPTTKKAR